MRASCHSTSPIVQNISALSQIHLYSPGKHTRRLNNNKRISTTTLVFKWTANHTPPRLVLSFFTSAINTFFVEFAPMISRKASSISRRKVGRLRLFNHQVLVLNVESWLLTSHWGQFVLPAQFRHQLSHAPSKLVWRPLHMRSNGQCGVRSLCIFLLPSFHLLPWHRSGEGQASSPAVVGRHCWSSHYRFPTLSQS